MYEKIKKRGDIKEMTEGHITLCFLADGTVKFYPEDIKNVNRIARRLVKVCEMIAKKPELAYHAIGLCEKAKDN